MSLYDPAAQGADPKWALPAKLDETQLHDAATKVQLLDKDIKHFGDGADHLRVNRDNLEQARELVLQRISGAGLKDKSIPVLWGRLMNRAAANPSVEFIAGTLGDFGFGALILRTQSAEANVLSGAPTFGDKLFIDAATKFMSQRVASMDREFDDTVDLCKRLIAEFPELELTYFDKDGVLHNQTEAPPVIVSKDEMGAMRAAIPEFVKECEFYRSRLRMNGERRGAIMRLRNDVLAAGNAKISAKLAEVMQMDNNSDLPSLSEIMAPSVDLLAGRVTIQEKAKFDEQAALFRKAVGQAKKEHDLQFEFADLLAKEDPRLAQILRHSLSGNLRKIWGRHMEDDSDPNDDTEVP